MYNWFTCKMTFDRQGEDGLIFMENFQELKNQHGKQDTVQKNF